MLAASTGRHVPRRASDAFVVRTFDDFAASFEAKLESLSYRAPALVADTLADAGLVPDGRLVVLDAGCGTGLCGPLLRPYASRLVGVDLSSGMLEHARRKQIYTDLAAAPSSPSSSRPGVRRSTSSSPPTPLCISATCGHSAEQPPVRCAHPGLLVFTVEHSAARDDADFRLELHGRYSHRDEYVLRVLEEAGLSAHIQRAELRTEAGEPVAGLVVRATKVG